jgi:hypothetical protein
VTVVFRRWKQSRVRSGDTLRTSAGVVKVDSVDRITTADITDADALAAGAESAHAVCATLRGDVGDPVFRIRLHWAGPDPRTALSEADDLSRDDVDRITERLNRLDRHSRHGAWTRRALTAIAIRPGTRAADLAILLNRDREALKRDIRKLKDLGLTRSLDVGYQMSPRGVAYLAATAEPTGPGITTRDRRR